MTAAPLVKAVHDAGGRLAIAGGKLKVSAPEPLPAALVSALRTHKGEVLTYLSECADAPRRALKATVAAWINAHPPTQPDPDTCAACGKTLDGHFVVLGDGAAIHYSGPHGLTCWERYQRQRRHEAEAAMGLTPPAE